MFTKFIEATDATEFNHGKFMVALFTHGEWGREGQIDSVMGHRVRLLSRCGWTTRHFMVFDLQTGEGAMFIQGENAEYDLRKHKIWVCPMFEPFLEWLYRQDLTKIDALPSVVNLGDVPTALAGYRRDGKGTKKT